MSSNYELVCGLEIHAELKTASKMFCGCKNDPFHAPQPNIYTCPVCLGMPGALPVANKKAIEWTIKLGLALGCKINLFSKFDRKHYFYPDLPKSYQISQYDIPFCYEGVVETSEGPVRVTRIHLEEDTGKLLHRSIQGQEVSLIDFNRSSVPLIEIVSEPDIKSAAQAKEYAKKLRQIIRYLDIADCDMEQGGMRLEANTSLRIQGASNLPNYKVEVKNINSFRFLEQAITYEVQRQAELLDAGKKIPQETRGYNATEGKTFSQRAKEDAADYRYFPDPDLPPIRFTQDQVEALRAELPELPTAKSVRWSSQYQIEARFAEPLAAEKETAAIFEELFKKAHSSKLDCNKLASSIYNKRIAWPTAESIDTTLRAFTAQFATDTVDTAQLEQAIEKVLAENPDVLDKYKAGNMQIMGFMMGQTMRQLGSIKPDPQLVRESIGKILKSRVG
jgi:aspartyl-tRNA(Asn)/glutamyl-tRNA(Gln) amidotransferase subunit B